MSRYKVGDTVKVRSDLMPRHYYGEYFTDSMTKFLGKEVTITKIISYGRYKIKDGIYVFSDEMFEGKAELKVKDRKEDKMKDFKIVDYKVYNKKVVVVWFDDGTKEKATCCELDSFDLERGIEVCVMKHIFGEDKYKTVLKESMKQIKAVDKAKENKKKEEEAIANKKAKAAKKKAKYRANRRANRVAEMKEAYLAAMKEYGGSIETSELAECVCGKCQCEETLDDLK